MRPPRRPAAYICGTPASDVGALMMRQHALAEAALRRGWPAPQIYADEDDPGRPQGASPALDKLVTAITAGRHDALIISGLSSISGGPACLLTKLLFRCTAHGVAVEFLTPTAASHSMPAARR
ncbi:MAG TPA: recombinase family protein [Streptosporangiaceae bacterium]